MDKIKLGLFDVFAYLLPGAIIIVTIYLLKNPQLIYLKHLFEKSNELSGIEVAILLVFSYKAGFINQYVSYEIFKYIAPKCWKKRFKEKETSIGKLEDKIVLIRHYSPENFNTLNSWLVFRSMCYSLFVSNSLLFFVLIIKACNMNMFSGIWLELLLIGFSSFAFLRRSVTFHEWIHGTINNVVKNIDDFKNK